MATENGLHTSSTPLIGGTHPAVWLSREFWSGLTFSVPMMSSNLVATSFGGWKSEVISQLRLDPLVDEVFTNIYLFWVLRVQKPQQPPRLFIEIP
jgi:hypothetical protein